MTSVYTWSVQHWQRACHCFCFDCLILWLERKKECFDFLKRIFFGVGNVLWKHITFFLLKKHVLSKQIRCFQLSRCDFFFYSVFKNKLDWGCSKIIPVSLLLLENLFILFILQRKDLASKKKKTKYVFDVFEMSVVCFRSFAWLGWHSITRISNACIFIYICIYNLIYVYTYRYVKYIFFTMHAGCPLCFYLNVISEKVSLIQKDVLFLPPPVLSHTRPVSSSVNDLRPSIPSYSHFLLHLLLFLHFLFLSASSFSFLCSSACLHQTAQC